MPQSMIRYQLDPTGSSPDNRIVGEIHELTTNDIRAISTNYGPYFTKSLRIFDTANNSELVKGIDYKFIELLQEPTVKFGKEICKSILIINNRISNKVRVDYQLLGGLYQNDSSAISNAYENVLKTSTGPVDWINVLNKPLDYPPSLHTHLLNDVYGFDALVTSLERIRNAIVLSDVPAFEAVIDWVKQRSTDTVTEHEIDNLIPVNKNITFGMLLYALDKLNFNSISIEPKLDTVAKGSFNRFDITATNLPERTTLFWNIEHISSTNIDFNVSSGIVTFIRNRGHFTLILSNNAIDNQNHRFNIVIRKNGYQGPIVAKLNNITIGTLDVNRVIDYLSMDSIYNPKYRVNPVSLFFNQRLRG